MTAALNDWISAARHRLEREPLFVGGICAVSGIALARVGPQPPVWFWFGLALGMGFACLRQSQESGRERQMFGFIALGLFFGGLQQQAQESTGYSELLWSSRTGERALPVEVRGVITEPPRTTRNGGQQLTARLETVTCRGLTLQTRDRIRIWSPTESLRQGDRFSAEGRLQLFAEARNPGEISPKELAWRIDQTVAELSIATPRQIEVTGASWQGRALELALTQREWVARAITWGLEPNSTSAQILQAMFLGERKAATYETRESFRLSGAMHIFAVSGLHVGIFATVIWLLLNLLGVSRRWAILVIIVSVLFYAWITGLSPSAVRAAIMATIYLGGFWLRRAPRLLNSLGAAALVILFVDPRQLFNVGFQLSFVVLMAIALIGPPLREWMWRPLQPDPFIPTSLISKQRWMWIGSGRRVVDIFCVSIAAWIGSLPLVLYYFGLVTPVALVANFVLVPLTWMIICLATISLAVFSIRLAFLAGFLNMLNSSLIGYLHQGALFFSSLPLAYVETTPLSSPWPATPAKPGILIFDTGPSCGPQFINAPNSRQPWLIDCGADREYASIIRPYLLQHQVRNLGALVVTHPDNSHAGGAEWLTDDYSPQRILTSHLPARSQVYRELQSKALPTQPVTAGTTFSLADEVQLEVLFPPVDYPNQASADDECLVLRVTWSDWRILFMADSGFQTEKWLLEHSQDLSADVLVKSQHGSDYSGLGEFLLAVEPQVIIATNATFPAHESIDKSWRKWVEEREIHLMDQSESGAIRIDIQEERLVLDGFLTGPSHQLAAPKVKSVSSP